ncbi:hypothetical protein TrVGV298_008440 [Trichoderma virens]|nr:hypothetical protein TrVGV298_008440 [Trichoderma virens]
MLDEKHDPVPVSNPNDNNSYTLGTIGKHNVVLACLPEGEIGTNSAASVAMQLVSTFPSIKFGLMVGIGGGIPPHVRLGDIVVSKPVGQYPGVVQWDLGKATENGFVRTGSLDRPPKVLLSALTTMKTNHEMEGHKISQFLEELAKKWLRLASKYTWNYRLKDTLFEPENTEPIDDGLQAISTRLRHTIAAQISYLTDGEEPGRAKRTIDVNTVVIDDQRLPGDPKIHYGLIASGNQVIKDSFTRDEINRRLGGQVLCLEMEAAGLMNNFPCLVIRGISDYADSKKNDQWRGYAAAIAAAFAKEFLQIIPPAVIEKEPSVGDVLNKVHEEIVATRTGVAQLKSKLDRDEDKEILDWLTSMDYGPLQSNHLKTHQSGTGQWFLDLKEFQHWITGNNHILFCHGIPGSGKTILTSLTINHLFSKFRGGHEVGMAYIYFDYKRVEEQKLEKLLASLLKQLAGSLPYLPESTKELYRQHSITRTRPSLAELITEFEYIISQYSKLFIVLDALDECQSSDLVQFLSKLSNLQKDHVVNILATSRPIPIIVDWFSNVNSTKLEIRSETSDITKYIEGHIGLLPNVAQRNLPLAEEIKVVISEAADGMFLLAKIYLTLLQDKMTVNEIREQLGGFKSQTQGKQDNQKREILREAYEQAIERINSQKEGLRFLAMRVLTWVTFVKREITILELQHALATEVGTPTLNHDCLPDLKDISYVCLGLVTVDEYSHIIRLAHYTAQQYLERTQNRWSSTANATIARCCLTYLSFNAFGSGACLSDEEFEDRVKSFPLYDYAANCWMHHISHDEEPIKEVMCFLQSQTKVEASLQAMNAVKQHSFHKNYSQEFPWNMPILHLTIYFRLVQVMKSLLERGYDPDSEDSSGWSPLIRASYYGQEATARLLIDAGAALEAKDARTGSTPLIWAIKGGHIAVVELLLDRGSNVNSQDRSGLTPLALAAFYDQETIVKLLLRSGGGIEDCSSVIVGKLLACSISLEDLSNSFSNGSNTQQQRENGHNLSAKGSSLRPLLSLAAENDQQSFIKLLIWTGMANLNKEDPQIGMTALHWAAKKGHLSIVERLANAGADLDAKESQYGHTPLVLAIQEQQNDVVELLLRRGANIHAVDNRNMTPLFSAACRNTWAVQQLLDKGANVNVRGAGGMTTLYSAAFVGNFDAFILLVERGADIHVRSAWLSSIFNLTVMFGRTDAVRLLAERGADVNTRDGGDGTKTPIMDAALYGKIDIVKLLVEKGADINARDSNGRTVLHYAALGGQATIIQILIDNGADINARNTVGDSALSIAVQGGREVVVRLMADMDEVDLNTRNAKDSKTSMAPIHSAAKKGDLTRLRAMIDAKADVEQKDEDTEQTPLQTAIYNGCTSAVDLLLLKGASVHTRDRCGQTPLFAATSETNLAITQLLLDRGADVNARCLLGYTPIFNSCLFGTMETTRLLIERGADINAISDYGQSPLLQAMASGNGDIIKLLLERGADVNVQNDLGNTPLVLASSRRHFDTARLLIERGADVNATNDDGESPIVSATLFNDVNYLKLLVRRGANVNAIYRGESLLTTAATCNRPGIFKALVDGGADVNARDANGRSVLFHAIGARTDGEAAFQMIMEMDGVDFTSPDAKGMTPLDFAEQMNNIEVIPHLIHRDLYRSRLRWLREMRRNRQY